MVPSGTVIFKFCKTGVALFPDPYCFQAPFNAMATLLGGPITAVFEGFVSVFANGGDIVFVLFVEVVELDSAEESSPKLLFTYLNKLKTWLIIIHKNLQKKNIINYKSFSFLRQLCTKLNIEPMI